MKTFVVLSVIVAVVTSKPSGIGAPLVASLQYSAIPTIAVAQPVVVNAISSQYHAQDALGQYSYGYASPLSSKAETKTFDGITRGGYSYLDAQGLIQSAAYVADPVNGFRVAATNIPVGPTQNIAPIELAPKQVPDSPEVAAAKAVHFAAIEEAKARVAAANAIDATQVTVKVTSVPALPLPIVPVAIPALPAIPAVPEPEVAVKTSSSAVDEDKVETLSEDKKETLEATSGNTATLAKQSQEAVSAVQVKTTEITAPALSYAYANIIGAHQPAFIASAPQLLLPNSISTYNTIAAPAQFQLIGQVPVAPAASSGVVVEAKSAKVSEEVKTSDKISAQTVEISAPLNYVAGWGPYYLTNK